MKKLQIDKESLSFKHCGLLGLNFLAELLLLLLRRHIYKTLLVISIVGNCFSIKSCISAKVDSDYNEHKAYVFEQQVDSLKIMIGEK